MQARGSAGRAVIIVLLVGTSNGQADERGSVSPPAHTPEVTSSARGWETRAEFAAYQDSDAVTVFTPALFLKTSDAASGWSAAGSYLVDVVSAASVDVVSSASSRWQEVRHAGELELGFKPDDIGVSLSGSASSEPDYLSLGAAALASAVLARKRATLVLGMSYAHDWAGRKDTPFSIYALEVDRYGISGSSELVLDRATTLTPMLDFVFESGRQEKPYRYLPLFSANVAGAIPAGAGVDFVNTLRLPGRVSERVPDERRRLATSARLAHRFHSSTFTVLERLYTDSWGLKASTSDLRLVVDAGPRFSFWPHARFHLQSGVSFWQRAYVGTVESGLVEVPSLRTGDRELSPIWSATFGPGARWDIGGLAPSFGLILELEATYTHYEDALYVEQRWAGFGTVQLEVKFR